MLFTTNTEQQISIQQAYFNFLEDVSKKCILVIYRHSVFNGKKKQYVAENNP